MSKEYDEDSSVNELLDYLGQDCEWAAEIVRECIAALEKANEIMRMALNELSRLGNGDRVGNSIGNAIAVKALREAGYLKEQG